MVEPTEISMPPVAITKVIPMAIIITGNDCSRIFQRVLICTKFGVITMFNIVMPRSTIPVPYFVKIAFALMLIMIALHPRGTGVCD
jgi:hypothetical protein